MERWALECLDKGAPDGGMILSFGGGVSPGTPAENIDALLRAAREWSKSATIAAQAKIDKGHGIEFGQTKCVRADRFPSPDGEDDRAALEIALAATESLKGGRPIELPGRHR